MSQEHWISRAILNLLEADGGLMFKGLAWMVGDETVKLSPKTMSAGILCTRHNSALSPLDASGKSLFQMLRNINMVHGCKIDASTFPNVMLLNGHDIERWFLKYLLGGLFSRNLKFYGESLKGWTPPTHWVKYLFGQQPDFATGGLYYLNPVEKTADSSQISGVVLGREELPTGHLVRIMGFQFAFVDGPRDDQPLLDGVLRPKGLLVPLSGSAWARVLFSWEHPGDDQNVTLNWIPGRK